MKTLIINGSPHKDGDTSFFINEILKNIDAKVISPYFMNFSDCVDCLYCVCGKCKFKDEVSKVFEEIDKYDNIIVATPLYFTQPTGKLMSFFSRTQVFFNSKKELKRKNGFVVVVGGGDMVVNSSDAEKTIRIMLLGLNVKVLSYVRSLNTSKVKAFQDKKAKDELYEMIDLIKKEKN